MCKNFLGWIRFYDVCKKNSQLFSTLNTLFHKMAAIRHFEPAILRGL